MYKTRIHKWGLDKKYKEREALAIVKMYTRRQGKPTQILLRGRTVDIKDVQTHLKRKRVAVADVLDLEVDAVPDLVCKTPEMSPKPLSTGLSPDVLDTNVDSHLQGLILRACPKHIDSPDLFKTAELLFSDVQDYVLSSFETGSWVSHGPDQYCQSKKASVAGGDSHDMYREIQLACSLFDGRRPAEAIQKVYKGFSFIRFIVEDQSVVALSYMIRSIAMLLVRQLKPIALMLCRQIYSAANRFSSRESLAISIFGRIFSRMGFLISNTEMQDYGYLLAALRSSIDSYNKILGPSHLQSLQAAVALTWVMRSLHGPEGLVEPLKAFHTSLERQQGSGIWQALLLLTVLVDVHVECDQLGDAEIVAQRMVEQATRLKETSKSDRTMTLLCHAYAKVSHVQGLRHNHALASTTIRKSQALSWQQWGREDWKVIDHRTCLWQLMSRCCVA